MKPVVKETAEPVEKSLVKVAQPKNKTIKITFTNYEGVKETHELSGTKVGHRIEPLSFPVVTIWANKKDAPDETLVIINPRNACVEIAS
jgi:hypothetical protein